MDKTTDKQIARNLEIALTQVKQRLFDCKQMSGRLTHAINRDNLVGIFNQLHNRCNEIEDWMKAQL